MNAPRRAPARASTSAARAALLALVLAASAGSVFAGFVDARPAPAPAAPAVGKSAAGEKGAVAMPVGGAAPSAAAGVVEQSFAISRSDKTIREALVTWSTRAGWTHDAEHWTVPFDLPVLSSADLGTDFKGAVRALLSSTDLTNMPLQPCFYSNKVLRVVPKAELCDRTSN